MRVKSNPNESDESIRRPRKESVLALESSPVVYLKKKYAVGERISVFFNRQKVRLCTSTSEEGKKGVRELYFKKTL